jgi:pimeloyl-ACP methyl ester carboxylesterase
VSSSAVLATREWGPSGTDGAAAPVALLVHGIAGWSPTWWRVAPALAELGWRVVAVDLRGHGTSPRISGVATAQSLAADIFATARSLGIHQLDVLIGHSLGAAVAMELAHAEPGFARRLVLEDPPGQTRVNDVEFQSNLEREVVAARRDPEAEVRRELSENPAWLMEDARQNVEGRAMCDLERILASLRANTAVRPTALAPVLHLPALYLIADEERSALGAQREKLLGSLPTEAAAIEFDSGHVIHRDRFDDYLAAIQQWLDGEPDRRIAR